MNLVSSMGSCHSRCGLKACCILWEPAWLMTSSLFHRLLSVCSIIQYTCPVFFTPCKTENSSGLSLINASFSTHFLSTLRVLLCFPNAGRIASRLRRFKFHVSMDSTDFSAPKFSAKTQSCQDTWFLSANVKYRLGQTLKIINFGSKLTQKVNFKEKSNETIQPKGWASWSGCHNWKTRWWDLFWYVLVMLGDRGYREWEQLSCLNSSSVWKGSLGFYHNFEIHLSFNVVCVPFVAPTFDQHMETIPIPIISTFASGLSGSKDGDMSTSTSWSFLPRHCFVGAESNEWW